MADRPRFLDDLAGVAGGAFSALAGAREELESQLRARLDEAIRKLDLVRREELDAVAALASNARAGQEAAEARIAALEARLAEMIVAQAGPASSVDPAPSASAVAPGTMPPAGQAQHQGQSAAGERAADASAVTPAAMPTGSDAPGSTLPGASPASTSPSGAP